MIIILIIFIIAIIVFCSYISSPYSITFISKVPNYEGECKATWLNKNQACHRLDRGITGFFKLKKGNEEFHGIIKQGRIVELVERDGRY